MDEADRAQLDIERAEAAMLARLQRPQPERQSYTHCIDCGGDIDAQRRAVIPGVRRCVDCQDLHELRVRSSTHW